MPVSSGYVNGNLVSVLRDTGCSGIVIKRSMIDDVDLTGKTQSCFLADGTRINAPVALISIDTPYLKGEFEAWCMDSPVSVSTFTTCFAICRAVSLCMRFFSSTKVTGSLNLTKCWLVGIHSCYID